MNALVEPQIGQLYDLTMRELREKYQELFGDESRTWNRQFLFRRIAWRLQAMAEGDLSERASPARDAAGSGCRFEGPASTSGSGVSDCAVEEGHSSAHGRKHAAAKLPGHTSRVKVCADGFDYNGQRFRSLSAVAFAIAEHGGMAYSFFGLNGDSRG